MGWGHNGKCEKNCSCDVAKALQTGLYMRKTVLYKCTECPEKFVSIPAMKTHRTVSHKKL